MVCTLVYFAELWPTFANGLGSSLKQRGQGATYCNLGRLYLEGFSVKFDLLLTLWHNFLSTSALRNDHISDLVILLPC
jgi:hypothetical protein